MAIPAITALKMWVGTLFTKDDWDFNFSQIVSWLSDGNSDLVVNTIKATNGIDLDGAQISNLGTATTGSQAVTLDQATTLLNRTSYYYPFSVASGKVDSNGNAAYLQKDSDTQVTVLGGNVNPDLVCISSDGTVESVTSNTVLTVPSTNGTYYIIKEKEQAITITTGSANKITIGKTFPSSQNTGDYFLDNSTVPFKGYKYGVSGWVETPFCYLGYVTVSGGVATVTAFSYNDNRFDVILVESYINGDNGYRVYSDGYCEQWGRTGSLGVNSVLTVNFLKPFKDTSYRIVGSSNHKQASGDKGSSWSASNSSSTDFTIVSYFENGNGNISWIATGYVK